MSVSEDQLVAWLTRHTEIPPELCPIGIGDDMAQLRWQADSVCITTDMLVEGVHFDLAETTLEQVGYKAMAVSLSDCAAMATIPVAAVVSLALPRGGETGLVRQLHRGLQQAGRAFDCAVVGGDTTRGTARNGLVVNVAMLSHPPAGRHPIARNGARVGDVIAVTGALGGSRRGHHLHFTPRVREALMLAEGAELHAMMDLSDGLSTDLHRLCRASRSGALIRAADLPLSASARKQPDPLHAALNDGEDFELLFTLTPADFARLKSAWQCPTALTAVGTIEAGTSLRLEGETGAVEPLRPGGYDHFQGKGG
jgi:thiamine-monophosphate kinase